LIAASRALPSGVWSGLIAEACVAAMSIVAFAVGGATEAGGEPWMSVSSFLGSASFVSPASREASAGVLSGDAGDVATAGSGAPLDDFPPPFSGSLTPRVYQRRPSPDQARSDELRARSNHCSSGA